MCFYFYQLKRYLTVLGCALLLVTLSSVTKAKDWRGLTPFHSTRAHVEKLLGEPPPPPSDGSHVYTLNKNRSIYRIDEGQIYIIYKRDDATPGDCLKAVPKDTVVFIQVTLKKPIPLKEFPIKVEQAERFDPSTPKNIGYLDYLDASAGFLVVTFKGNVVEVCYFAMEADRPPCPDYLDTIRLSTRILIG
jgi:hypothetical protein